MCGILGIFKLTDAKKYRKKALAMAKKLRHRGPDWSGIYVGDSAILAHERLSIVDVEHGAQPLIDKKTKRVLAVNGEIYTHKELEKRLTKEHDFQTKSDCEVLLYLYDEFGAEFLDWIDGIFAFALYDKDKDEYFIARDHIGIVPLYMGWDDEGSLYVASEMKALDGVCSRIKEFPPGHFLHSKDGELTQWYKKDWMTTVPKKEVSFVELKERFEESVKKQLMSDVPYGVLISGGLDSSLVAAIAARFRKQRIESGDKEEAWWPQLHSFSVGLEGSPDLKFAKIVADHVGTVHHEVTFTIQEGIDAIRDVIYHLETYDVTSIRAATPMYLMSRVIKSMGIKMVLSGEGADEIFGGYLYFHMAPDKKEFHEETVRKLKALSKYDCCRANKAPFAWGLETRVPFLGKEFVDYAMSIDPEAKMCKDGKIEKHLLREACKEYLPKEILWRQKEQFSDGVGYSWIDSLKDDAEKKVSDRQMQKARERFPVGTPTTKEAYVYREIFDELFTCPTAASTVPSGPSIACSTPTAYRWSKSFEGMADPSGRAIKGVHEEAVERI